MRRDLRRGEDIPLLQVVTDDPRPDHLRISVLNRFSENEFSSGDRDVPAANRPDGVLPPLQGVSPEVAASARSYDYAITIGSDFESRWLPTQAPISAIDAAGDWRFDASTMDFLATPDDLDTAGARYAMTAVEYDFRPDDLRVSPLPEDRLSDEVTALPDSLPTLVSQIARGVTAGQPTPYDKAVALQQWFREDGGFVYDLTDAPTAAVGTDELEAFLRQGSGRVGYCEQFATAMAVMARVLDIPSRVAVGFLTPDRTAPDTYVYSAYDLHAWPELYFPGAGWVLFDPTPSARVPDADLPAYTTRGSDVVIPSIDPEDEATRQPSGRPSIQDPARPTTAPDDLGAAAQSGSDGSSFPWWRLLAVVLVLGLLLALAVVPRTVRTRQRARRLAGGPESAWEELRATTVDLRQGWPESRSPRETQAVLVSRFGRAGDQRERPVRGARPGPGGRRGPRPHRAGRRAVALRRRRGRTPRACRTTSRPVARRSRPAPPSASGDARGGCPGRSPSVALTRSRRPRRARAPRATGRHWSSTSDPSGGRRDGAVGRRAQPRAPWRMRAAAGPGESASVAAGLPATTPTSVHPLHERSGRAGLGAGALRAAGAATAVDDGEPGRMTRGLLLGTGLLLTTQGAEADGGRAEHQHEAHDADVPAVVDGAGHQHGDAHGEHDTGDHRAPSSALAQRRSAQGRGELRVLLHERALHLLQKSQLLFGEWHRILQVDVTCV